MILLIFIAILLLVSQFGIVIAKINMDYYNSKLELLIDLIPFGVYIGILKNFIGYWKDLE